MTLGEWLRQRKYDPDNVLFLSIGTDGLNYKKNSIMSISVLSPYQVGTQYIKGANPEDVFKYTEVSVQHYNQNPVEITEAVSLMQQSLQNCSFIVTYNKAFQIGWLQTYDVLSAFTLPFFDILNWFKIRQANQVLSKRYETITDLIQAVDSASVGYSESFQNLQGQYLKGLPKLFPELEMKTTYLKHLWNIALTL